MQARKTAPRLLLEGGRGVSRVARATVRQCRPDVVP